MPPSTATWLRHPETPNLERSMTLPQAQAFAVEAIGEPPTAVVSMGE